MAFFSFPLMFLQACISALVFSTAAWLVVHLARRRWAGLDAHRTPWLLAQGALAVTLLSVLLPASTRLSVFADVPVPAAAAPAAHGADADVTADGSDGDIGRVDLRRFYTARALRILPLLCVVLAVLTVLALAGVPGFAPWPGEQSVGGLLGSALTFTFNWYEGRTGWAPAGWDVLWSLSIEEIFYIVYPILCVMLPRRALVGLLFLLALALVPLRSLVPVADEVWWEKAYWPGMAAIAWGVLAALLAQRWRPGLGLGTARVLALLGALCIVLVVGWSDIVHRYLFNTQMYLLCVGTCMLLLAFHAQPPVLRRGLRWLAAMGRMSYELYLSHMFIVLATVSAYRALLGSQQTWTFLVYLPVLACCYALARQLERGAARILPLR